MAYEYCRECCHELTVIDKFCPECGKRARFRLFGWDDRRLGIGQIIGIGICFIGYGLIFSDYREVAGKPIPLWFIFAGMFVCALSPYRK